MAGLNPHAPEFRSYSSNCSYVTNKWIPVVDPIFIYGFTGVTVTAKSPEHPCEFTWHINTDILLVGPAWLLIAPPASSSPPYLHPPLPSLVGEEGTFEDGAHAQRKKKKNNRGYFNRKEIENGDENEMISIKPLERWGKMTTVMIKNIPNQYTRDMLMNLLDEHCRKENEKSNEESCSDELASAYDFLYLPIDFRSSSNKGYAFVNLTRPNAVWKLNISWNHTTWPDFKSNKIRELTYAKLQGKQALMQQFEDSVFPCDKEEYLPVCFHPPRDGLGDNNVRHMYTVGSIRVRENAQIDRIEKTRHLKKLL